MKAGYVRNCGHGWFDCGRRVLRSVDFRNEPCPQSIADEQPRACRIAPLGRAAFVCHSHPALEQGFPFLQERSD